MTREQIEKAADRYQFQRLCDDRIQDLELGSVIGGSFMDGAEWRINSVWHDGSEIPDLSQDILIIFKNEICTILIGAVHTLSELKHYDYTNWAYVKDLLPIKEDEK